MEREENKPLEKFKCEGDYISEIHLFKKEMKRETLIYTIITQRKYSSSNYCRLHLFEALYVSK